ncbi:MAG: hypothetical protein ACYYK0_01485 [Candidatus Eutrophobiaceae bacterium]
MDQESIAKKQFFNSLFKKALAFSITRAMKNEGLAKITLLGASPQAIVRMI